MFPSDEDEVTRFIVEMAEKIEKLSAGDMRRQKTAGHEKTFIGYY